MADNGGHDEGELDRKTSQTPPMPAPPNPEQDKSIVPSVQTIAEEDVDVIPDDLDIFTLQPVTALKLLCRGIDKLVSITGDIPPTPPARSRAGSPAPGHSRLRHATSPGPMSLKKENDNFGTPHGQQEDLDGVPFTKTPMGSPEARPEEPTSTSQIIGAHAQPIYLQHGAIARKFWSKRPPPISTEEYLMRMHKYCPMSTAVYLATSHYITRLAVHERLLPVTPRNVHRLLLAGLRVAMKALEDLSWPHGRFSKVGGVSEGELGRLEITFCFLMDFNLKVGAPELQSQAENLAGVARGAESAILDIPLPFELKMSDGRPISRGAEKRKASSTLPSRPAIHAAIEVMGQS